MAIGRDYLACRGPCSNRARVRRGPLEVRVLVALGSELMRPELMAAFVAEFTAEWNRLQAQARAGRAGKRVEPATH
ncbi:hypothetical protein [Falsiroseomonas sp. HW251]|uniref:hypothetical protein n=1 Tax=Falsiroseomonas sp. HW251 TaxID=3390998 RepID=UPI003D31448F